MSAINPTAACSNCGGKPALNCFDGPDGALTLIAGFCPACGRLGPMRAEVADACAEWDADNAKAVERLNGIVQVDRFGPMVHLIDVLANHNFRQGDRVLIVLEGGKA